MIENDPGRLPAISVVMAVYNGAEHLQATIDSVLRQSEPDFEFVIVDDGSTDDTPRILARASSLDPRIRVITRTNAGLTRALIQGCLVARAPLLARQDAGDESHPHRLRSEAALFGESADLVLVGCRVEFTGPRGEFLYRAGLDSSERPHRFIDAQRAQPALDGPAHHGAAMFRREAYLRAGGYRAAFYYGQDWDLWYRLGEIGTFACVNDVLYTARVLPGSISARARRIQERSASLAQSALRARSAGRSDTRFVEAAAALPSVRGTNRRASAAGLYFIGEALRRNGDPRSDAYLRESIVMWPLSLRARIRLFQSRRAARKPSPK